MILFLRHPNNYLRQKLWWKASDCGERVEARLEIYYCACIYADVVLDIQSGLVYEILVESRPAYTLMELISDAASAYSANEGTDSSVVAMFILLGEEL